MNSEELDAMTPEQFAAKIAELEATKQRILGLARLMAKGFHWL